MLLQAALTYAAKGWRIIPLWWPVQTGKSPICACPRGAQCGNGGHNAGKHPIPENWPAVASTDPAVIRRWWQDYPTANVGILPGNGLVTLDIDPRNGGQLALEELEATYGALPETPTAQTGGGGTHHLFASAEALPSVKLAPGIDFLADDHHQFVAVPSVHHSGNRYLWELSSHPDDIPLAPLPAWVRVLAQRTSADLAAASVTLPAHLPITTDVAALNVSPRIKTLIMDGAPRGERSEALWAVLRALVHAGYDDGTIAGIVLAPERGISAKPLEQKNSRSPRYWEMTRGWIAKEISRARAKPDMAPATERTVPMMGTTPLETTPEVAALIDSLRFPFVNIGTHAPPLPARAQQELPSWRTWLDQYAEHSAYWAPRAAPAYHKAVGLWVLSTVAARRIVVEMGSTPVYPTLFLTLVSPSTSWTKTTAAAIGIRLLRKAGCGHLLAPDRTTPQFLLKIMAGIVPQDYGNHDEEGQAAIRQALGFTAQRGWFYEEWGGMLTQMKRIDSPHAELNKLLIVLEGGAERFETGTIQRGLERIEAPYLALLGNATPRDLVPFMEEGNAWWHDGFWPRFACITPPMDAVPSRAPRPRETYHLPGALIQPLHEWHTQLGVPAVDIFEEQDKRGNYTGIWNARRGALPTQQMTLDPLVYDAYETYNDALLEMVQRGDTHPDLSAWYGRAHEKALRVAMLLASVHGEYVINRDYWAEGQAMAEHWRRNLHEIVSTIGAQTPLSKEGQLEAKVESLLSKSGGMTARELQRHAHVSADLLQKVLTSMLKVESVSAVKSGKKVIYVVFNDDESQQAVSI